jgi:hypothetical protein
MRANPSMARGHIVAVGRGVNLAIPDLPLEAPVIAQLIKSDGPECWESVYSAPAIKNTTKLFKDKND